MDLKYLRDENQTKIGPDYIHKNPGIAVPYLVIISMATLLGTVGNALVITAIICTKKLKTTGNMFIVNLALADLCVTAFVNPFSIVGILRGEIWFDDKPALCEVVASICLTSCFCSLLNIGAISFNRYIHICHNGKYNRVYTVKKTLAMCACLWLVSFLLELPNFIGWGDHVYDRKTLSCVWDRTADVSYSVFFSVVGVGTPILMISVCYLLIFRHVKASRMRVAPVNQVRAKKESMRLARTLFVIFVVFSLCWTPYAIIVAADVTDTYAQGVHIFSILLAHTNSSLNFLLYGLTNQHFRLAYIQVLGLKKFLPASWFEQDANSQNLIKGGKKATSSKRPSRADGSQNREETPQALPF